MPGYQRPGPTQRTNIACHAKLMEVLTVKENVDIYVFRDPEPKLHAGVPINLAAGLEDGLILEFRPPWNQGRAVTVRGFSRSSVLATTIETRSPGCVEWRLIEYDT